MQTEPHFSWLREFAVPVFFTLFGVALGYITTLLRDERKAKRDKKAFLRAVGVELDALRAQLDDWGREVTDSLESLNGRNPTGPQYSAALQTIVFSSQLGKLRDVDDPLLAAVVLFYTRLSVLQQSLEVVNATSAEYTRAETSDWLEQPMPGSKGSIRPRLIASLTSLQKQVSSTSKELRKLREQLPPPAQPSG